MRRRVAILALVATACGPVATSTTTTTVPAITSSTSSVPSPPSACTGDFVARGPIERFTNADADAVTITGVVSEALDGCDRVTIQLATAAGAPATAMGDVNAEWLPDRSVVRVRMAGLAGTAVSDQILESLVLDRLYVVRSLDGGLFVDLVAAQPAAARAIVERDPARVVVELVPSPAGMSTPPALSDFVVVTGTPPLPAEYPFVVEGYARTFEANVLGRIGDELVGLATAADWLETWGEFRLDVSGGPSDPAELFVGTDSPRDGSPQGVIIPLR